MISKKYMLRNVFSLEKYDDFDDRFYSSAGKYLRNSKDVNSRSTFLDDLMNENRQGAAKLIRPFMSTIVYIITIIRVGALVSKKTLCRNSQHFNC